MLAELHGKVDLDSTLPVDRLEDTLTDAVFSALRYLPRRTVLGAVLRKVLPQVMFSDADLDNAEIILWPTMPSMLWPGRSIEPDVVVVAGRHVVVFEAKYHSGFGQYELGGRMVNQLAVQWRAASSWAAVRRAISVTVVAVTADATPPASLDIARAQLSLTAQGKPPENRSRAVRWMPWWSFARIYRMASDLLPHEEAVRRDVLALMKKRGVSRVFEGFRPEDYYLVTAAQRVAGRRLYPEISTFVVELTGLLHHDGIDWGWPQKGLWAPGGLSWTKPQDWGRPWLAASFWPGDWPKRLIANDQIALYVLFDFTNPAVEVGYVQSPVNASAISLHWQPHYEELAAQLTHVEDECSVAVDTGDWTTPAVQAPAADADARWLGGLDAFTHLRLRRRLDFTTVTTTQIVEETLGEVRRVIDGCPAFHAMLRSSSQLAARADDEGELPGVEDIATT